MPMNVQVLFQSECTDSGCAAVLLIAPASGERPGYRVFSSWIRVNALVDNPTRLQGPRLLSIHNWQAG